MGELACACSARHLDTAKGFAPPEAGEHYSPDLRIEPVHIRIEVAIDIPGRSLHVQLGLRAKARSAGVKSLALDGVDLREVRAPGYAGQLAYDGKTLWLTWPEPFAAGEEREVALQYRVERPITGVSFSAPRPDYPSAPTFAVTDHETERARYWLTTIDHPSVRPTLELSLRADARFTLLANGARVGEELHPDGTKT
ncbi:MAG TPA: hypothetical protein VNN80_11950, partial [Polyangiaceae bacterium]|nr:hypothetical protein [Polyangiaceae bacterium]